MAGLATRAMRLELYERWPLRLTFPVFGVRVGQVFRRKRNSAGVELHRPTNGWIILLRQAWWGGGGQVRKNDVG